MSRVQVCVLKCTLPIKYSIFYVSLESRVILSPPVWCFYVFQGKVEGLVVGHTGAIINTDIARAKQEVNSMLEETMHAVEEIVTRQR